jgi:hypothetical protein
LEKKEKLQTQIVGKLLEKQYLDWEFLMKDLELNPLLLLTIIFISGTLPVPPQISFHFARYSKERKQIRTELD